MTAANDLTLEQCIALKLMLDIRFFDTGSGPAPVTSLPRALADGLASLQPGGIILFRENLLTIEQSRALSHALRQSLSPAALIAIDQEGGRVTRLPRDQVTNFSGNMALAACPADERTELAYAMGRVQGEELSALGININFAPTLDVNSNPQNPVINVRAFGDDAAVVASLGEQIVRGLQGAGVAAAVKHFPGHGDTSQDSHTDLPCVLRDAKSARRIDLAPFADVIATAGPSMVMTAHIQYPALDAGTLPASDVVVPATLSRPIVSGLLREQMGFSGVVISDALDMRAISDLMTPLEAVLGCFRAGVDIALMPVLVRSQESLKALADLVSAVAKAVQAGALDEAELRESAARVLALQSRYAMTQQNSASLYGIACDANLSLEKRIAEHSVTLISGALPRIGEGSAIHLLMPGPDAARALCSALHERDASLRISWQSLDNLNVVREREQAAAADAYLLGVNELVASAVDLGGAEDLDDLPDHSPVAVQKRLLIEAHCKQRIVLMLGSPYGAAEFAGAADCVLASYDGAPLGFSGRPGPAYQALAGVLLGKVEVQGQLPVSLACQPR